MKTKITTTVIIVATLVLSLFGTARSDTFEVYLDCEGEYAFSEVKTTDFNIGVEFTEISSVYIDWSGEITGGLAARSSEPDITLPVDGKFVVRLRDVDSYGDIANIYTQGGVVTYPDAEFFDLQSELTQLNYETGVVIVRFENETLTDEERNALLALFGGGTVKSSYGTGLSTVELPQGVTVQEALTVLENADGIIYAEPNHFIYPFDGYQNWPSLLDGQGEIEVFFGGIYSPFNLFTEYPEGKINSAKLVIEGIQVPEPASFLLLSMGCIGLRIKTRTKFPKI